MSRRILFLIRGKLGDSLGAFAAVQLYLERHPEVDGVLAMRADYAALVAADSRAVVIPFSSRIALMMQLVWWRLTRGRFDVCAVVWGFGDIADRVARLSGAPRRIYLDARRPRYFTEWPAPARDERNLDPCWRVLRLLDADLPRPTSLSLPALAARRVPGALVLLAPVADDYRRSLDATACAALVVRARAQHPDAEIRIMVNPLDATARDLIGMALPEGVRIAQFSSLAAVIDAYVEAVAWYGVDTGLLHLAVAIGLPVEGVFGPSRPGKVLLPEQAGVQWFRLRALGVEDCTITDCMTPHCLHLAVATRTGTTPATTLAMTPSACPLRAHADERLAELDVQA
jgi:ADP-heptose:LPS heptosyltransferase